VVLGWRVLDWRGQDAFGTRGRDGREMGFLVERRGHARARRARDVGSGHYSMAVIQFSANSFRSSIFISVSSGMAMLHIGFHRASPG